MLEWAHPTACRQLSDSGISAGFGGRLQPAQRGLIKSEILALFSWALAWDATGRESEIKRIRATSRAVVLLASGGLEAGWAAVRQSRGAPLGCVRRGWDHSQGKTELPLQLSTVQIRALFKPRSQSWQCHL